MGSKSRKCSKRKRRVVEWKKDEKAERWKEILEGLRREYGNDKRKESKQGKEK